MGIGFWVLRYLFHGISTSLSHKATFAVISEIRTRITAKLTRLPMGYFNDNSLGYITSVTTNTCENLQDVATRVIMLTTQGILTTAMITLSVFNI